MPAIHRRPTCLHSLIPSSIPKVGLFSAHASICRGCPATVATIQNEADLRALERAHVCDPPWAYRSGKGCGLESSRSLGQRTVSSTSRRDRLYLLQSQISSVNSRHWLSNCSNLTVSKCGEPHDCPLLLEPELPHSHVRRAQCCPREHNCAGR